MNEKHDKSWYTKGLNIVPQKQFTTVIPYFSDMGTVVGNV